MRLNRSARAGAPSSHLPLRVDQVLAAGTPAALALWLASLPDEDITSQLIDLDDDGLCALSRILTPDLARTLMDVTTAAAVARLVAAVPVPTGAGLLDILSEDEAARVIRLLEEPTARELLDAIPRSHSALLRGLLSWPEESAASWMRPSVIAVDARSTLADAMALASPDPEELEDGVFVLDDEGEHRLAGWVPLTALAVGPPDRPAGDAMVPAEEVLRWSVEGLADQESVLAHGRRSPSGSVPVVDAGRVIGIVTRDAIARIAAEEAREDTALQGGSSPLDGSYRAASPWQIWRARVIWLAALFLAEMYTGTVMRAFEDELESVVALSFFIPLLIGTGGNVGTQITTTLVRAMSAEGLRLRDVGRVIGKELAAGLMLGLTMAALGAIRAWTLGVIAPVMATVALALLCVCLWSSLIASVLPWALKRIGLDPAVVSAPMISTIVDGTGLVIYFMLAQAIVW